MKESVLRRLVYAIEGYTDTDTPELQIVSFNQRKNGDYEVIIRHNKPTETKEPAEKSEVENENNE